MCNGPGWARHAPTARVWSEAGSSVQACRDEGAEQRETSTCVHEVEGRYQRNRHATCWEAAPQGVAAPASAQLLSCTVEFVPQQALQSTLVGYTSLAFRRGRRGGGGGGQLAVAHGAHSRQVGRRTRAAADLWNAPRGGQARGGGAAGW
jgi:hypothetical protein